MRSFFIAIASSLLLACGGLVAEEAAPPETNTAGVPDPGPPADEIGATTPPGSLTCTRENRFDSRGTCASARDGFWVEASDVAWISGTPWSKGAVGSLRLRVFNNTSGDAFHYPGAVVASSDARIEPRQEWADLYMIAPCSIEEGDVVRRIFDVRETLPSGTKVRFDLAARASFREHTHVKDDGTCAGTLKRTTFVAVVP